MDRLGERGIIELGIRSEATLAEATQNIRRRRRHRFGILQEVELELDSARLKIQMDVEDVSVWRGDSGFKKCFSTSETWRMIRESTMNYTWVKGVWFSSATPKFTFITWLAMLDRGFPPWTEYLFRVGVSILLACYARMQLRLIIIFSLDVIMRASYGAI